jgi:hypothetical protein
VVLGADARRHVQVCVFRFAKPARPIPGNDAQRDERPEKRQADLSAVGVSRQTKIDRWIGNRENVIGHMAQHDIEIPFPDAQAKVSPCERRVEEYSSRTLGRTYWQINES